MAHYAFLNSSNIVLEVIVGRDEDDNAHGVSDWEAYYSNIRGLECKRTSYNTYQDKDGVSHHALGGIPFRGKYACIGDTYDSVNDVFVSPPVENEEE